MVSVQIIIGLRDNSRINLVTEFSVLFKLLELLDSLIRDFSSRI